MKKTKWSKWSKWFVLLTSVLLPCFLCESDAKPLAAGEEYQFFNSYKEHPAWSPSKGKILFVLTEFSNKGYEYKLCLVNADGTNFTELPGTTGILDNNFCWSPNGNGIIFAKKGDSLSTEGNIYVISRDGSVIRKLTSSEGHYSQLSWSPDGTKIAFTKSFYKKPGEIWLIDSKAAFRKLTDGRHHCWSPDGKRIAFMLNRSIKVIDFEGKEHYSYFFSKPEEWWIAELKENNKIHWSADTAKLLFMPERDYNGIFSIGIQDNENKGPVLYTNSKGNLLHPISGLSLSPDGKEAIFATFSGISKMEITKHRPYNKNSGEDFFAKSLLSHVKGLAGYGPRLTTLLTKNGEDKSPCWSPDGMKIAFIRGGEIWIMDSDGLNQIQLTKKQTAPKE